jgi:hypothetical protein
MNSSDGRTSGSSGALGGGRQAVEEKVAVGEPGQAVVDGIVQEPLLRALGVGGLTHQSDAAQVAAVAGGQAGGVEIEPAVGVVDVAHAELDAHLAARALLHRPQEQLEALAVGRVHVGDEAVGLGGQLARLEAQRGLDDRAHLDLVAPRIPLPHRRAGAVHR